ncbi:MAG: IclR family transcriptional regulator [Bryobacteraceae bacterium]|nr:IclR family transcriptional regulator [Bryobacteraceae bacterium]
MKAATAGFSGVKVLHKTVDILETLRQQRSGMALHELSSVVALPKPTVYRILATLESRGYLGRTADGDYRLSRKMFEEQQDGTTEQMIIRAARREMEKLLSLCKETLNLGVLDGREVLVIETIESPQTVRMSSKIGNRRSPHSTALGKVLLAGLPQKDVLRMIGTRGLPRFTQNTIVSEAALLKELEKVRRQGYALDNSENEPDGRCIAAPIYGSNRNAVAALSISGPLPRMTMSRARTFREDLFVTCESISCQLGGVR